MRPAASRTRKGFRCGTNQLVHYASLRGRRRPDGADVLTASDAARRSSHIRSLAPPLRGSTADRGPFQFQSWTARMRPMHFARHGSTAPAPRAHSACSRSSACADGLSGPATEHRLLPLKSHGLEGLAGPAAGVGVMAERVAVRSCCGHLRRVGARLTLLDGVRLVMGNAFRNTKRALRNGNAGIQPGG